MTKKQLATKMRTKAEMVDGVPVFHTKAWTQRRKAINQRVKNGVEAARSRRIKREKKNA